MSRLVLAEELLVLLNSNSKLIFIAKILLKLFFSNFLHPLKLKAPPMVLSNGNVFKITFIPQWTFFPLVRKMRPFLHEKVVITHFDACRWFYAPIYAKRLPLTDIFYSLNIYRIISVNIGYYQSRHFFPTLIDINWHLLQYKNTNT